MHTQIIKDWGPDKTGSLRRRSKSYLNQLLSDGQEVPTEEAPHSKTVKGQLVDSKDPQRVHVSLNKQRVGKHAPLEQCISRSILGMFHSKGTRKRLLDELEKRQGFKLADLDWTQELPDINQKNLDTHAPRAVPQEEGPAKRPFYWSHPPEGSMYLRGKSRASGGPPQSNKFYRAMPYGSDLSPAAKLAYGAQPKTPIIGNRAAQSTLVDPNLLVLSAELSRAPDLALGFKPARGLTGFY